MSFLKIRINVDIIYKPTYKPLQAQMLAISIAQSELSDELLEYLNGNIDKEKIERKINSVVTPYKISFLGATLGSKNIVGEESWLEFLGYENEKVRIEVVV